MPENWVQHPVVNTEEGTNPGAPLAWGSPENPDDAVAGYGYVPCDTSEVEETFYYHSDHLGSTSYITDQQANVTQYDAYLPYGELLVDEHSSSADLPYKFNGKELDEETGLYYYGARYMSPVTSMWYGVDAMAEGKTSIGSYVYCMGNPIRMIDPDGNWERNSNGNLVAQKGDNAVTLGKYLGIDKREALGVLTSNGVTIGENGVLNLSVGQEIKCSYLPNITIKSNTKNTINYGRVNDINKAVAHLNAIASNRYDKERRFLGYKPSDLSSGHCAMHVSMALEFGGFDVKGHPVPAYRYNGFLQKKGWKEISPIGYIPQKGDIIVMRPFVGRKEHPSGHIQMWNGSQWVSDFKQNALYAGRDYRECRPKYIILRFEEKK